jgi:hypothetical protein
MKSLIFVLIAATSLCAPAAAQSVLFDLDSAPLRSSPTISVTSEPRILAALTLSLGAPILIRRGSLRRRREL